VRKLREQDVSFSDLPGVEYTPRQARYYLGKSSPLGSAQGRLPQQNLSSAVSQRHTNAEKYQDELREESEEPDLFLNLSPEKDLDDDDETFQIDPTTRHESEMRRHQSEFADNTEFADNAGLSDVVDEGVSAHEETFTPRNPKPANKDGQGSTWFQKITSYTPAWLKAPARDSSPTRNRSSLPRSRSSSHAPSLHNEQSDEHEGRALDEIEEDDVREHEKLPSINESESELESESESGPVLPAPQGQVTRTSISASPNPERPEEAKPEEDEGEEEDDDEEEEEQEEQGGDNTQTNPKPTQPRASASQDQQESNTPLATSGYFTNAHYTLLRRLYRLAKNTPGIFPYHPKPSHAEIIGDYIWTSDNAYGVAITKQQFAIIHRFRQELAVADRRAGGSGYVGWTEAELHRRLVSLIIGEQIREDIKNEERATRAMPKSIIQRG
jgi:hypothetical protein